MSHGVSSASGYAGGSTPSGDVFSSEKNVEETKQQFLELLVAQMKNQDPFAPADATQFTQQMMMMGQLEQLVNLNTSVGQMAAAQQGSLISQYAGIVGHEVIAEGNQFEIGAEDKGAIRFYLPANPASVEINVFDRYGNLVRSFDPGISLGGEQKVAFDGKNLSGEELAPGYYSFTVDALDGSSEPIMATMYSSGKVSSIRLENGTPIFQMGEEDLGIGNIKQIF